MNVKIGHLINIFTLLMMAFGVTMCSQERVKIIGDRELAIQLAEDPDFIKAIQAQQELHNLMVKGEVDLTAVENINEIANTIRTLKSKDQIREYLKKQDFKGSDKYAQLHMENVDHMTKAMEHFPQFGNMKIENSSKIIQEAIELAKIKLDDQLNLPSNNS